MSTFEADIAAWTKKAGMSAPKAIKGVSMKLFSAVIDSSPVDTGRFRANWTAAGVAPSTVTTDSTDQSGSAAKGAMMAYINGAPITQTTYTLANNLPYAGPLEFGYSRQAPQGMVRVNVARFQQLLKEAASES